MDETLAGVRLTHPDRVLYPEQGLTKRGLAAYYVDVADWVLPHVTGRPLTLVRCPRGRQAHCFYQKHVSEGVSEHVRGIEIREREGTGVYMYIEDVQGLVSLVQMGTLELHPWGSRNDGLERPDRLVLDLDPGPGVHWSSVVEAGRELRERLGALGLESFARLTGGRGLHVVVPVDGSAGWGEASAFSRSVAEAMAADAPTAYVTKASKALREGRIFIDWLRNTRGATSVASYSPRARPGAPVATPVRWDELSAGLAPDRYSTASVQRRLAAVRADPWDGFFAVRQAIPAGAVAGVRA